MKVFLNHMTSNIKSARKGRFLLCTLISAIILFLSTFPQSGVLCTYTFGAQEGTSEYELNIRSDPGTDQDILGVVSPGDIFTMGEERTDEEGNTWVKISNDGVEGFILARYAVEPTQEVLDRIKETETETETEKETEKETETETDPGEETGDQNEEKRGSQPAWSGTVQSEEAFEAQLSEFPESYKAGLREVHEAYPNYTFSADYIDMDFQALVDEQIGKKVSSYYAASWKAMYDESFGYLENYDWDTGEWFNSEGEFTYASREVIAHFTDPRNFLDTKNIYMFMRQSYSPDQTVDDLRSIIDGSFLSKGYVPDDEENDQRLGGDYAAVLMEAARISGSSPYVLAASILLEHGFYGETPLISGYYKADDGTEYKEYYNFYDIGATGSDSNNVIQNGLEYAKEMGWTSRYLSIVDGAIWVTDSYINNGQDTYYYKEFNVINGWDALWHQFSTGVMTAYSSSSLLRDALSENKYAALDFRIPVYQNMSETPSEEPEYNENLNNYYIADMEAKGLEPEFSMANRNYTMTVVEDTSIDIAVPKWAVYEGKETYQLHAGENTVSLDVRSQTGYLRTYVINISSSGDYVFSVNCFEGNRLKIADAKAEDRVWGDADGDGKVTSLDYIAIKKHIMEEKLISDETLLAGADANEDGRITALDYIAIKNYIMGQ